MSIHTIEVSIHTSGIAHSQSHNDRHTSTYGLFTRSLWGHATRRGFDANNHTMYILTVITRARDDCTLRCIPSIRERGAIITKRPHFSSTCPRPCSLRIGVKLEWSRGT